MSKVLIKWNRPCIYTCGEMRLMPGFNEVNENIWNKAKENAGVKKRIELELIVLTETKKENDNKKSSDFSISSLSDVDAKKIISKTYDIKTLESWKKEETRKQILNSIDAQIESLIVKK